MVWCLFFFFPLAPAPLENTLGRNVTHGHCGAGRATVLPELWDYLSHLASFLHCHTTAAKQSVLSSNMSKAGMFLMVAVQQLWQYALPWQMPELSLLKAINGGNPGNFLPSFWYSCIVTSPAWYLEFLWSFFPFWHQCEFYLRKAWIIVGKRKGKGKGKGEKGKGKASYQRDQEPRTEAVEIPQVWEPSTADTYVSLCVHACRCLCTHEIQQVNFGPY